MKRLALIAMVLLLSSSSAIAQDFCFGDFFYDGDVDAIDMATFLEQFGRGQYDNPCPPDGPSPVAKTGQTTAYYEGDDGDHEKGIVWPEPRFTDNEDGTVTDNLTGLIWLKNANCFGPRDWYQALTDCNVLANGQCGLTDGSSGGDWRLPNRFELESLLDLQYYDPALSNSAGTGGWAHGDPFINLIPNGTYWSSTTDALGTALAWLVGMINGGVGLGNKIDDNYVWPVRGGH